MYKTQEKSWMDSEIFTEWIKQLDRKFLAQNRKGAFIVDNCSAHPHVPNLTARDLVFLPPNRTSVTQPMDQGVIRSLKAKYRARVIRKYINAMESKQRIAKNYHAGYNAYARAIMLYITRHNRH